MSERLELPFPGDPFAPRRRPTRVVRVGDVALGGDNPIRIQSMTTTDTQDVAATVAQTERLAAAGCEIVRITAPSVRDAEALGEIRAELFRRGVRVPLVADIHFTPNAALVAAEHVEKVRINPGNFADKKKFEVRDYDDAQWDDELARVADRFRPLLRRCKELGRALRIGTNHGSLSDRVMNRYGDTPRGMVESALEFLDVCEDEGFYDVVFSMKASNPQVAIQAYRLLAALLSARARQGKPGDYPFHVGVTEAGDGEDGRIKSAIGIGSLLADGLGDTIRVSLTEDPVKEVPVARAIAQRVESRWADAERSRGALPDPGAPFVDDPYEHARRASECVASAAAVDAKPAQVLEIGGDAPVRAELSIGAPPTDPEAAAWRLADAFGARREVACEGLRLDVADEAALERVQPFAEALARHGVTAPLALQMSSELAPHAKDLAARWIVPVALDADVVTVSALARAAEAAGVALEWSLAGAATPSGPTAANALVAAVERAWEASRVLGHRRVLVSVEAERPVPALRLVAARMRALDWRAPIVLVHRSEHAASDESELLHASTDLGALLCDGIGDAVALPVRGGLERAGDALALAYRILQGARQRTTWTEFISCPSCGRTLFDLEETTARIKAQTQHLKGVKIAIMGCIVNGPGEMADADFGYVGSGPGVVNLYVGHDCVERHVPQAQADACLIDLIRRHGRWVEPE
ncbi:MAG: 1-hydroxy-2-methyl-2-(E)-butenyl 4-diphosphate synthase [Deltaproteobacteria bacterium]|nr:1-hydroxy-2-methyl-2-(E)-butenyl 4-diphosphate synthase [Deltaproteobacteria bacterium]